MWRIRSSNLSSASASNNNNGNNDPPALNRRDPDEEHFGAPVVDRPLCYSNVATSIDNQDTDSQVGLMVVPPAMDHEDDDSHDHRLLLSVNDPNPQLLSDSSLLMNAAAAAATVAMPDVTDEEEHQDENYPIASDLETVVFHDKEEEEIVLVDEMTTEEEEFLESLDIEPVASFLAAQKEMDSESGNEKELATDVENKNTRGTEENEESADANAISPQAENDLERMVEEAELLAARMKAAIESTSTVTLSEQEGNELERMVQEAEHFTAQVKAENRSSNMKPEDDFSKLVWPVWRYFTIALAVYAFTLLGCGSFSSNGTQEGGARSNINSVSLDVLHSTVPTDVFPRTSPAPKNLSMAPITTPLLARIVDNNSTNTQNSKDETDTKTPVSAGEAENDVDTGFNWQYEVLYVGSLFVAYYVLCFWIRSGSFLGVECKMENDMCVQEDLSSLNSFHGMMAFHQKFKKSGRGRRATLRPSKCSKFDASPYEKLTRPELLKILDGFERYVGRDAAKFTLIYDLCALYEDTLYRFSNAQILEILNAKGYSVNTTMSKQELVALAVKVGF